MKITDVSAEVLDLGQGFQWAGMREMQVIGVLVRVTTDTEHEGHAFAWTADLPAAGVVSIIDAALAPKLLRQDPHDRPRILEPMWRGFRVGIPLAAIGVLDVALWDLVGKAAGRPIADLLGRTRDRIKACASAPPCERSRDCGAMVGGILEQGFRALKLHVSGDLGVDIETCRLARDVAGPDVELMMDAMGLYDRPAALRLGRVLDELDFRWFEDPLRDDDLEGWARLRGSIDTPLAGVDSVRFSVRDYAAQITQGPFDILRMDAGRNGITELRSLATLAQAHGLGCEGHSFGPALSQAANLQVGLSTANGEFCELPVPLGGLDLGVHEGLALDQEGYVLAPDGPGLGLRLDPDAVTRARIG